MEARYRLAGRLSRLSLEYVAALDCDDDTRQRFTDCLTKFESCAIAGPQSEAMHVFDFDIHESHFFFLSRLYKHVRSVTLAEAGEALRDNSTLEGIKSMRSVLLDDHQIDVTDANTDPGTGNTTISFNVLPAAGDVEVTRGSPAAK